MRRTKAQIYKDFTCTLSLIQSKKHRNSNGELRHKEVRAVLADIHKLRKMFKYGFICSNRRFKDVFRQESFNWDAKVE